MRTLLLIAALGLGSPTWADQVRLQDNAPDRHVVVRGDTLWDISAKFLKNPWLWPEVWQLNRAQIKNPHLIYPGDVILLTFENGKPRLSLENAGRFGETLRLSPRVRGEPIVTREEGIPAIPLQSIQPFMARAGVIDPGALDKAPRLLGAADERVMMTRSDVVYASADASGTRLWHIVRPGKALVDPDSRETLGHEAVHVGDATTLVAGNPQTLVIAAAHMEILRGDKLIPAADMNLSSLIPRVPGRSIEGKIISAFGGLEASGRHATVVLNRGARDGLEAGNVLAVYHQGRTVPGDSKPMPRFRYADTKCLKPGAQISHEGFYDPKAVFEECPEPAPQNIIQNPRAWRFVDVGCLKPGAKVSAFEFFNPREVYKEHCRTGEEAQMSIKLPDTRVGLAFVYKVHDKLSYALILQSDGPIYLLDNVRNP